VSDIERIPSLPPTADGPDAATSSPPSGAAAQTAREMLHMVDEGWAAFREMAARFPSERMDEHLTEDGWTRKQMLFHIGTWHDLTTERLIKYYMTGEPVTLDDDEDTINARAARQAVGRTAGEILGDVEGTFNRLRRQLQRLTDKQLRDHDAWAAEVIAGNTYGHYAEHAADIYSPEPEPAGRRR
jgi:hypothetical protein